MKPKGDAAHRHVFELHSSMQCSHKEIHVPRVTEARSNTVEATETKKHSQRTGFLNCCGCRVSFRGLRLDEEGSRRGGGRPHSCRTLRRRRSRACDSHGDGGAVAMVEPGGGRGEILSCVTRIDGGRYREFWSEFPASRYLSETRGVARGERMAAHAYRDGRHYPTIDLVRTRETAIQTRAGGFR